MARQRFSISNFDQFKRSYESVTGNISRQNALRQAFPDYYKQLMNEYKTNILTKKKIGLDKAKPEVPKSNIKPTVVKDVVKAAPKVSKAASVTGKALEVGGKAIKGFGALASRIAPIQGAVNLFSEDSDITDRVAGAGMIGTGLAATASAGAAAAMAPWATALVVGDVLKKNVARPVGEKIGQAIYGKEPDVSNIYSGLADVDMPDPMMKSFTPEQEAKLRAYNKGVIDRTLAQADDSLARNQALQDDYQQGINNLTEMDNQLQNDMRGGQYTVPSSYTQSGYGVYPHNSQDAREGGWNEIQDILHSEPYKPSLKPIVEPVNYSNEYLASQNNLINQLYKNANQGEQRQMSMNGMAPVPENPYDLGGLRPYAQIDNQQQGLDYGAILNQFNDAMKADQRQNQINQMVNAFGVFGTPAKRAPIYFIDHKGKMQAIELDQPSQVEALPTNTTSNYDKLMGQLKIQQAQQSDALARQKQAAADLKAQQEYIANQNMMNALGQHLNVDPNMFANPDIAKAALQYVFNPDIQSRANVQETIGKAPTQAMLKAAEQRGETAGKLDEVQLQSQYNAMIANINNNAKMEEQAMIQSGMDRRTAAQIATQRAINQYTQMMNNIRTNAELSNALQLQGMRGQNALDVAGIYANRQSGSEKPTLSLGEQVYLESVKSGNAIPQALKYAQVVDPNFGLSDKERAELNR